METKHLAPNNTLAFSLEGAAGPEIDAPSRFARALKQARFRKGWTQAKLAAHLTITKRALVSWETATRIPSIGMVMVLLNVLSEGELSLSHELLSSYILDDLENQVQRKDPEGHQKDAFVRQLQQVISRVEQMAADQERPASRQMVQMTETHVLSTADEQREEIQVRPLDAPPLEPLFALLDQLHQHPDLIPVANDFVRELTPKTEQIRDS